ncbi:hypothetical protein [Paenibacillus barengoltzii]|uniref:Alginate lyase domain-containing protein n=1 Tax=Paenibacillus barengoltzii G22 TaxID=1235795 RepID=R9LFY6_9BACL|nr:hypothetical protein C812_00739 [Paenibacillus barengoltzii G22]
MEKEIYDKLVAMNDEFAQAAMELQVLDPENRFYGGVIDPANGIAWPSHGGTPKDMAIWACALVNEDSRFYHSETLLKRLELAAQFMLRSQHADGSITPPWTNLHSPPDTAFVVSGLAQVYELLDAHTVEYAPVRKAAEEIRLFLERTLPVLLTGGCHTPNHRWVLCSALGFMYKLTGRPELKERAEAWLAEGIDCTEDGEWTERSNGIYNAVSDIVMIFAAEQLGLPALLEPVRRNLRMMAYLIHPDGEVVTDYSGRQDYGYPFDMSGYFLAAKWLANRDKDPLFEAIAELAGRSLRHPSGLPNHALLGLLRYPELRQPAVPPVRLPEDYRVVLNGSFPRERYLSGMEAAGHHGRIYHSKLHPDFGAPIARHRHGKTSATVMTEANSFFALRHGSVRLLAVQLASAFAPGYVKLERLEVLKQAPEEAQEQREAQGQGEVLGMQERGLGLRSRSGYRLSATERKGYYAPVAKELLPETARGPVSPWYLLPHHRREVTHEQQHRVEVEVLETAEGWSLRVQCAREEPILTQLTFLFGQESEMSGEEMVEQAENGMWFWKQGKVRFSSGEDWIELHGGVMEHQAAGLNNTAIPVNCRALVVNLLTPYDRTFELKLSP